jgi:hypothetical protein
MSDATLGAQVRSVVTLEAKVFPICVCGQPWPAHAPTLPDGCEAYRPVRPIKDHGVISRQERS